MTTATPTRSMLGGVNAPARFTGTIIKSIEGSGDRGRYWQLHVLNERTGKSDKMSVNDSDPELMQYYRSNKYLLVEAFKKAGFIFGENTQAGEFEGQRYEFLIHVKENQGGFPPTILFLPQVMLEPADPSDLKAAQAALEARFGGQQRGAQTNRSAPHVVEFTYTPDQLEIAAEVLDGVAEGALSAAIARADVDPAVKQGLFNGTIITQAKAAGVLDQDDDGVYHNTILGA